MPARLRPLVLSLAVVAAGLGCGKKGAPLAPLARVPAKVADLAVQRSDADVFVSFTVPTANVGGAQPADLERVEIYAETSDRPVTPVDGAVAPGMTIVATLPVRRPPPPGERTPAAAEAPAVPAAPGLVQGQHVTIREVLGPAAVTPAPLAPPAAPVVPSEPLGPPLSPPLVWMPETSRLQRHYAASGVSRRGRRGPWSDVRGVPVGPAPGAPAPGPITYDAARLVIMWTPARDARVATVTDAGLLPSRPFGPPGPLTKYNVYDAPASATSATASEVVTRAAPLNAAPLDVARLEVPGVAYGRERCVVVRAVDASAGAPVEGPASVPVCVTPVDTFAPPAPAALEAVGGAGVISLIWEGVDADDLAGYLVLRGQAPGEATTLLTPAPIRESSFEDRTVTPGVRYVYVVVAVDSATPANRSAPSNRVEETARQ